MLRLIIEFNKPELPMNIAESVSQYDSCKLWIDSLRSEYTKAAYSLHISLFCKFYHTNPDELVKVNPQELKDMIIKYILELRKKSKNTAGKPKKGETSVNTIKMYLPGIKSFLNEHEIGLPWK
jgi:hypothetical protein